MNIWSFIFNLFKPAPQGDATPQGPIVKQLTIKEKCILTLERIFQTYIGKKEEGKNRGAWVDEINKFTGADLGEPYCISGILFQVRKCEIENKVKFDIPKTPSTQSFFKQTKKEYIVSSPEPFSIGIMQQYEDPSHGHGVYVLTSADEHGNFHTYEFNTDADGSRNGDGFYLKTRNIKGDKSKKFLGYVSLTKALKEI